MPNYDILRVITVLPDWRMGDVAVFQMRNFQTICIDWYLQSLSETALG